MKKTLSVLGAFLLCAGTATVTLGADASNNGTGGTLTMTDVTAGFPPLTFTSSPNVSIATYAIDTAYAIMTTNTLTDTTNGMEYGTLSTDTGYSQRAKSIDAATAIKGPTNEVTLSGSDWVAIGGS